VSVSRLLIFLGMLSSFLVFPISKAILQTGAPQPDIIEAAGGGEPQVVKQAAVIPQSTRGAQAPHAPKSPADHVAIQAIENLLARYSVDKARLARTARAIVASSRKHKVDPRLVASIMIVESGANPYAVSPAGAIGIMQIHLPTWGPVADQQGVDLFRLEDNVDFGARILREYILANGIWEGVMRYKGWLPDNPASHQSAQDYALKVRRIYDS
jgi:hypothetical protein